MNTVLKQIYSSRCVLDSVGTELNPFPDSISYECGRRLYDHVREFSFSRTLETGLAFGLSALFFCQAHHDAGGGLHTAMDPFQGGPRRYRRTGLLNIERAGLTNYFQFFGKPAHAALSAMCERGEQVDLVFLDGDHRFDYVLAEFLLVDLLLIPGGHIVFHDIWMPAVQKAVRFILRNRSYRIQESALGSKDAKETMDVLLTGAIVAHNPELFATLRAPVCVLEKTGPDARRWNHHAEF